MSGMQDLVALLGQVGAHLVELAEQQVVLAGGEVALGGVDREVVDGETFGLPLGEAAVEDGDVGVAEEAQHPPGTGRGHQQSLSSRR